MTRRRSLAIDALALALPLVACVASASVRAAITNAASVAAASSATARTVPSASASATTAPAPDAATAAPDPASDGLFDVRLDGEEGTWLERPMGVDLAGPEGEARASESELWQRVCIAPCRVRLPAGAYRVGARGRRNSSMFRVTADVEVDARLGSSSLRGFGWALVGVSGASLLAAGSFWGVAQANPNNPDWGTVALVAAIGAGVSLVLAAPMFLGSTSSVRLTPEGARATRAGGLRFIGNGFAF